MNQLQNNAAKVTSLPTWPLYALAGLIFTGLFWFALKNDSPQSPKTAPITSSPSSLSVTSASGSIGQAAGAAVPAPSSSMSPTGNPQQVDGSGLGTGANPTNSQLIIE